MRQNGAEGVALLSHVAMAVLALFLGHLLGTDPNLPLILLTKMGSVPRMAGDGAGILGVWGMIL